MRIDAAHAAVQVLSHAALQSCVILLMRSVDRRPRRPPAQDAASGPQTDLTYLHHDAVGGRGCADQRQGRQAHPRSEAIRLHRSPKTASRRRSAFLNFRAREEQTQRASTPTPARRWLPKPAREIHGEAGHHDRDRARNARRSQVPQPPPDGDVLRHDVHADPGSEARARPPR